MNIKSLHIETVFSGFIHFIWLTLLTLNILGESPHFILSYLSKVDTGISVLLSAILFSFSFFLGRIAEHFLIAVNYLFNKSKRQSYADSFEGTKGEIWGNKIFSLSSFAGLLFGVIALYNLTEIGAAKKAIVITGGILCLGTVSSFIYWFCFGRRVKSIKIIKRNQYWLKRLMKR